MRTTARNLLHFDIDHYLNPWIPRNRLGQLPRPLTHFFGYRSQPSKDPPLLIQYLLTFVATVAGICLAGAILNYAPGITKYNPPVLIASLGASATLDFNAIRSPLAQPRNAILGHTISAIVAIAVSKGFQRLSDFNEVRWVAGAVACAVANVAMSLTGTVHPPGGATAVLATINPQIIALGWMFAPIITLTSALLVVTALIFNNTLRQYPLYWWTPEDCGSKLRQKHCELCGHGNGERTASTADTQHDLEVASTLASSQQGSLDKTYSHDDFGENSLQQGISILPYSLHLPRYVELNDAEMMVLKSLQEILARHMEVN